MYIFYKKGAKFCPAWCPYFPGKNQQEILQPQNKKLNLAFIYIRGSLFENSENPSKTENLHQNFKKPRLDFLNCTKVRNSSLIFITVNCYGAR